MTTCRLCMQKKVTSCYIGETSRSMKVRRGEHVDDMKKDIESSHLAHNLKNSHREVLERQD